MKDRIKLFESYRGSILHKTNIPTSDIDYFDVFAYDLDWYLSCKSLCPVKHRTVVNTKDPENDRASHELLKFASMLKKGNPNSLIFLYNTDWIYKHDIWDAFIEQRAEFISLNIVNACVGMAKADMRYIKNVGPKHKKYYNSIFSYRMGRELLCYLELVVDREKEGDAQFFKDIKLEKYSFDELDKLLVKEIEAFESAEAKYSKDIPFNPNGSGIDVLVSEQMKLLLGI